MSKKHPSVNPWIYLVLRLTRNSLFLPTADFNSGIGAAQMLGRANYLALVGGGRNPKFPQNKVIIWDDAKQKPVINLEFRSEVLAVRLSRSRIIVVLLSAVHIYAFSSPPNRLHVFETDLNPFGLVHLGEKMLAFPGRRPGHVNLFDLTSENVSIIPAHSSALSALVISPDGKLLATASETGTLVRVYSTATSAPVTELRRGLDRAKIYSIAISPSSAFLAVASDKGTLHIFDLMSAPVVGTAAASGSKGTTPPPQGESSPDLNKRFSLLGKIPLLPKYFSSQWSFTQAKFEGLGRCAIGWTSDDTVVVISPGDCRWEKFVILDAPGAEGGKVCEREAWRRFWEN